MPRFREIEMPDYLPSRYESWFHLYLHVIKSLKEFGEPITEETTVKIFQELSGVEIEELMKYSDEAVKFYHFFPLTLIKARALDYVLQKFPTHERMIEIQQRTYTNAYGLLSEEVMSACNDLLDVSQEMERRGYKGRVGAL